MPATENRPFRVVFMGTAAFAVPALEALCAREEVVLVVTRPDRPAGRGRRPSPSPVKEAAQRLGLAAADPERIRDPEAVSLLRGTGCDLIVVAAYGRILPAEVLEIPPRGCWNIHASLLPRHRGAAPVAAALMAGDRVTGITVFQMDAGMDTGPVLVQKETAVSEDDTAGTLTDRLARLGSEAVVEALDALRAGRLRPRPQDPRAATYAAPLTKEHGRIRWDQDARRLRDMVRAMDPWPGAYTTLRGETIRIWRVRPSDRAGEPGRVLEARDRLVVGTGTGSVEVEELQLPGRRRVRAADFLRGNRGLREGDLLGE